MLEIAECVVIILKRPAFVLWTTAWQRERVGLVNRHSANCNFAMMETDTDIAAANQGIQPSASRVIKMPMP